MNGLNALSGMSDLIRASNMRWKNNSNIQQTKILFFVFRSPVTLESFNLLSVASLQTKSPPSSSVKHALSFVGSNPMPINNCRSSNFPWYPPSLCNDGFLNGYFLKRGLVGSEFLACALSLPCLHSKFLSSVP